MRCHSFVKLGEYSSWPNELDFVSHISFKQAKIVLLADLFHSGTVHLIRPEYFIVRDCIVLYWIEQTLCPPEVLAIR